MTSRTLGYIRVSTQKQNHQRQIASLEAICDELHIETISAVKKKRPVFDALLEQLQAGDTLVVHDLDRAFRSNVDALIHAELLKKRGVEFKIMSLNIDTNTESGSLIYGVLAIFGQHERECLSRRTKEGLQAARSKGKRIGRPPKLSPRDIRQACANITLNQATITSEAKRLGVCRDTLRRSLQNKAA